MVEDLFRKFKSSYNFFIPVFWRPSEHYSFSSIQRDILAGVTVSAILIPQSMALALAAGLPSVYGLYASLFGFLGSVFGSSRHLSTGPVAVISILTLASLSGIATPMSPEYITLAAILAFLVGLMLLLAGLLRLGFLVHLVPHTVIAGFSSAAALIIIVTQIPTLLSLQVVAGETLLVTVYRIFSALPTVELFPVILGGTSIAALLLLKRFAPNIPNALVLVCTVTPLIAFFHIESLGITIVGNVPSGLPAFAIPGLAASSLLIMIPKAAIIALIGFVEAYSIGKIVSSKTHQKIDIDQELVGQGIANLGAGLFKGFPVSGSFSRTAINVDAGALSAISAVVTAVITLLVILFFTPLFYYLPRNVLAAIVIVAALPLFDWQSLRKTYRISKPDGYVAIGTFLLALIVKPDDAIFIGMLLALMFFVQQTAWGARITEMAINPTLGILRRVREVDEHLETVPGTIIIHIGAPLYYANAAHMVNKIEGALQVHAVREQSPVTRLVIDASAISFADITGIEILGDYFKELQAKGISTEFIYLRTKVVEILERTPDFPKYIWRKNIAELRTRNIIAGSTPRSEYI